MEEEQQVNPNECAEMRFVVDKSGSVSILIGWNKPQSREELLNIANNLCGLIFHLSTGKMFSTMHKSMTAAGELRGEPQLAKLVTDTLDEMVANNAIPGIKKPGNVPLVSPRKVFNVRNDND